MVVSLSLGIVKAIPVTLAPGWDEFALPLLQRRAGKEVSFGTEKGVLATMRAWVRLA